MEEHILNLLQEEHILHASTVFNVAPKSLIPLAGFENFIYEGLCNDQPVILRLSHSSKKDIKQIASELAFIYYLSENGADVARPLPTHQGELIAEIPLRDNSYFSAVCFEKAPGNHPDGKELNSDLFHK